jgi:hypothetical protein
VNVPIVSEYAPTPAVFAGCSMRSRALEVNGPIVGLRPCPSQQNYGFEDAPASAGGFLRRAAAVTKNASGALDFAAPVELFQSPLATPNLTIDQYSVTKDGKRFLFIRPRETAVVRPPVTVVVNWATGLKPEE